jgi:short repeat uncharacterized protein DUF308
VSDWWGTIPGVLHQYSPGIPVAKNREFVTIRRAQRSDFRRTLQPVADTTSDSQAHRLRQHHRGLAHGRIDSLAHQRAHRRGHRHPCGGVAWDHDITGEWLPALSGVMSVLFGILVFAFPDAGAVGIAWVLGIYAAAAGVVLIVLGLRLRSPALVYSS